MPRKSKHAYLLEKSVSAAISAIEIYNKPDFKYREESFCILMVNAWELLLKAKILKESFNDLRALYVPLPTQANKKRIIYKTNRAGNFLTIEIRGALNKLEIDTILKENILLLVEIRDNAIHFFNESKLLEKKVLEIGTSSLKSFVQVAKEWFDYDLSQYNFYLMPISFFHPHEFSSFSINDEDKQHQNLLKYILKKEDEAPSDINNKHNISLVLETRFVRSNKIDAFLVRHDPNASVSVRVDAQEQFANKYPWTYSTLLEKLKTRYIDFKLNNDFHSFKKTIETNDQYCGIRFLAFAERKGAKMKYYSPEILKAFDQKYNQKQ